MRGQVGVGLRLQIAALNRIIGEMNGLIEVVQIEEAAREAYIAVAIYPHLERMPLDEEPLANVELAAADEQRPLCIRLCSFSVCNVEAPYT